MKSSEKKCDRGLNKILIPYFPDSEISFLKDIFKALPHLASKNDKQCLYIMLLDLYI